ncbi:hypothetical protein C8J57DRAFT_1217680 [Mycena rebaudengoi]|nr:hypothetical protein C8J57DRAFT_1217680 [Mycena rebaudengoi]
MYGPGPEGLKLQTLGARFPTICAWIADAETGAVETRGRFGVLVSGKSHWCGRSVSAREERLQVGRLGVNEVENAVLVIHCPANPGAGPTAAAAEKAASAESASARMWTIVSEVGEIASLGEDSSARRAFIRAARVVIISIERCDLSPHWRIGRANHNLRQVHRSLAKDRRLRKVKKCQKLDSGSVPGGEKEVPVAYGNILPLGSKKTDEEE